MDEQTKIKDDDRLEIEHRLYRRVAGILLFPIALFPLLSLLTYDWRDIAWLNVPPLSPPANLIGVAGAWSVFIGYSLIGLALWIIPLMVLLFSSLLMMNRIMRVGRRMCWMLLFLVALCCLVQLGSTTIFDGILARLNLKPNAGGAIGYWLMTCLLTRWFSPVGGGILMLSIMLFSLLMAIGLRHILTALIYVASWCASRHSWNASTKMSDSSKDNVQDGLSAREHERQQRKVLKEAAQRAKEAANQVRLEERQRGNEATPTDVSTVVSISQRVEQARQAATVERDRERRRSDMGLKMDVASTDENNPKIVVAVSSRSAEVSQSVIADYPLPTVALLNPIPGGTADHGNIEETSSILVETLRQFNVPVEVVGTTPGPIVTQYELRPAPNIKVERIASLTANLQMALEATSLRVQAPIPGKNAVGIELPNRRARPVTFREVAEGSAWRNNTLEIPLLLGKDVAGKDVIYDLTKAPHLLVAGATGSGKSVCLNAILTGFLMSRTPDQLRLILVDPKRVEFTCYNDLPHLLVPVINDPKKVAFGLRWAIMEMEKRYRLLQKAGCRNIVAYNHRQIARQEELFQEIADTSVVTETDALPARLPYIVIVVDEVADIMAAVGKEVEPAIARLTALSRAVGIHLILATQRPSVDVITGTIKSNIPGRIAFKVSQANDSRTILDNPGAEELIGKGDFLFLKEGSQLMRAQGAWVEDDEIARVVDFVKGHCRPCYDQNLIGKLNKIKECDPEAEIHGDDNKDNENEQAVDTVEAVDELMPNALEVIRMTRRASTTMLQRRLGIGYTRAARLMDKLEEQGVIGPPVGAGIREILIDLDNQIPANTMVDNTHGQEELRAVTVQRDEQAID